MTRMFGGLVMIDVMSICTLTLLVISLGSRDQQQKKKPSSKRLESRFITLTAQVKSAADTDAVTARKPILLGIEARVHNRVFGTADVGEVVVGIDEGNGVSRITLSRSTEFATGDAIHVFVRDRGSGSLSNVKIHFEAINLPGRDPDAKFEPVAASDLSWEIPLTQSSKPGLLPKVAVSQ